MNTSFNQKPEHQRFFQMHPEFIITRRTGGDDHEPIRHVEPGDFLNEEQRREVSQIAERTVQHTRSEAERVIQERGGIVEIWQRVGCYKAGVEDWS